jgi:alanine dehydrogenase
MPYVVALAEKGWVQALRDDAALAKGLNAHQGVITNAGVAHALNLEFTSVDEVLAQSR